MTNSRNDTIATIKQALKARSGRAWSVTGGKGTAYGWITIDAPPARRTARHVLREGLAPEPGNYDYRDTGEPGGNITTMDSLHLASLLGLDSIHHQGVRIPASSEHYREYIKRAKGEPVTTIAEPYWD